MSHGLNLPTADLKIKKDEIWDILRKKYVKISPEEIVRQHFVHYMIDHLGYPSGRMASEYTVDYYTTKKRCDIVVFGKELKAELIVECKAPDIELSEDTFYQIAKYTHVLQANYLILTNGLMHYCAYIDHENKEIRYLETLPAYSELIKG